jgi:glycopeptide antibiotics resistance protein
MTVWATEFSIAIVLFLIAFPLALMFLVYHHYHKHGTFRGWSALVTTLTFFYIMGIVAFTLFPLPERGLHDCVAGTTSTHWQLVPLSSVGPVIDTFDSLGIPGALVSSTFLQVLLNMLLLAPLGMLLAYRYKKSLGYTVLAGLGVSLLIEVTQGTGVWRLYDCPYRLADVDDLITNTIGVAAGWAIATLLARWLPDPTPARNPDLAPPTVRRRMFAGVLDLLSLVLVVSLVDAAITGMSKGLTGRDIASQFETPVDIVAFFSIAIALFWVVPVLRRDDATPGQIVTWLASVNGRNDRSASAAQTSVRFVVRWVPMVAGLFFLHPVIVLVVFGYESLSVLLRSDRNSLSGAIAHTVTVTRRSFDARVLRPR